MAQLRKAANGYDYYEYAAQPGDWDVLPKPVQPVQRPARREHVEVVERVHPNTLVVRRRAILNCAVILLAFFLLVGVVYRYSLISTTNLSNIQTQQRIDVLNANIEMLELEIASMRDMQSIQETAKQDLGMDFPEPSQIRYIALNQPEVAPQEEQPPAEQEQSAFSQLWNSIAELLE